MKYFVVFISHFSPGWFAQILLRTQIWGPTQAFGISAFKAYVIIKSINKTWTSWRSNRQWRNAISTLQSWVKCQFQFGLMSDLNLHGILIRYPTYLWFSVLSDKPKAQSKTQISEVPCKYLSSHLTKFCRQDHLVPSSKYDQGR